MIDKSASSADLAAGSLSAPQKARLIYDAARSDMSDRLWRAALGAADGAGNDPNQSTAAPSSLESTERLGLDRLLAILDTSEAGAVAAKSGTAAQDQAETAGGAFAMSGASASTSDSAPTSDAAHAGEGGVAAAMTESPNARYASMLDAAATRTGLPASALAAIVDAEAAKGKGGMWQSYSRNPRSSAAGLGQFLNRTWEGEAERKGTWLNHVAQVRGWLDANGQVKAEGRGALLAMRYDPRASIEAVADYAQANITALRRAGVQIGEGATQVAQAAYLGHHLGVGDAKRFLGGGLSPDRARKLLDAQVGSAAAVRRIAQAGSAVAAHRTWLLNYVGKNIRPERFA